MNIGKRAWLAGMGLVGVLASASLAQFVPPGQEAPQTPGGASGANSFPGPRGTTITFPTGLYDEKADPRVVISEARERARKNNTRVLVMWGENRCGFCVFMNDLLLHDPTISPLVKSDYEWVKIDIGKFDKNIDLATYYNTPLLEQGFGAPALTIIDGATDRALDRRGGNAMVAKPMTMTRVFDEKVISDFLSAHRAPAQVAMPIFNNALSDAKKAGKNVLAMFVVHGSDEAKAISSWSKMATDATAIGKALVPVKIDTQRMIGGNDLLKKTAGTDTAAAPFIVMCDPDGKLLGPDAMFTQLPTGDGELKQFDEALSKYAKQLSKEERDGIVATLKRTADMKKEAEKAAAAAAAAPASVDVKPGEGEKK